LLPGVVENLLVLVKIFITANHQGCDGSVGHSPAVDYLFTSLPQGGSDEFPCNDCRQAKDVIKQLKKRITNKNAAIQILALTVSVNFKCEETVNQGLAARNLLGCVFAVSGCMHACGTLLRVFLQCGMLRIHSFYHTQNGLLWLQVFETLVKNCGDSVHQQIAEKDVLHEMVKIVKKKVSTVIVFYQVPVYYFLSSLCQDCS